MDHLRRLAVTCAAIAALTATGSAFADPGYTAPYPVHLDCVERGNQGILNGEWSDYECQGPAVGPWTLVPR